ncbi:MAG: leucine-rich repeat domain-containing protein [Treponema sp.]|nr:leucine-rich repeat domain-containing protein [Treponema sp.]
MLKKMFLAVLIPALVFVFVTCKNNFKEKNETDNEGPEIALQTQAGDFGYIMNQTNDGIIITYKTVNAINVVLPDSIENLPVTGFQPGLFRGDTIVQSITLPVTITAIPNEAFSGCTGLSSITLPGVITVGNNSFRNTAFSDLTLPAAATIGSSAFRGSGISSITLPSIVTIAGYAFMDATSLEKVTFGEELTTLGYAAFSGCINLKEMNVPDSLTIFQIEDRWNPVDNTFLNCNKLPFAARGKLKAQGYSGRGF